jgi:protein-tyrosine phosphatase
MYPARPDAAPPPREYRAIGGGRADAQIVTSPGHEPLPRIRVSCVCLGNICRSPMAAALLRDRAKSLGVSMDVSSAGTSDWHPGRPAHPHAVAELSAHGIHLSHAARTFRATDFADLDLVLAMDAQNVEHLRTLAPRRGDIAKIYLIRDFDRARPENREVPDPYYGGAADFRRVFRMLNAACLGLLARIRRDGPPPWPAR